MTTITPDTVREHLTEHMENFIRFGLLTTAERQAFTNYIGTVVADIPPEWFKSAPNIPALLWRYGNEPDACAPLIVVTPGQWAVSAALTETRKRLGTMDIYAAQNFAGAWVLRMPGYLGATLGVEYFSYPEAVNALNNLRLGRKVAPHA